MKAQKYLVIEIRSPLPEGVIASAAAVAKWDELIETIRHDAMEVIGQNGFEISVRIAQPRGAQRREPPDLTYVLANDDAA